MSDFYADNTVFPWLEENRWPHSDTPDEFLVVSVPVAASSQLDGPIAWHSAVAGLLQVKTAYDPKTDSLRNTSVCIDVPGFGPAIAFSAEKLDLESPKPTKLHIPKSGVSGELTFSYDTQDKTAIRAAWILNLPWLEFGTSDENCTLFPTQRSSSFLANKLQNLQVITDSEVSALRAAPQSKFNVVKDSSGRESILFNTSPLDMREQQILASFIHDNVAIGNPFVTIPALSGPKSEGHTLDINFLGVFLLVGTILPENLFISATFYIKIPVVGRVKLVELKGDLIGSGVSASINLALAKGSVTLNAIKNASGKHDLYFQRLSLEAKYLKKFEFAYLKIFGLPF